MTKPNRFGPALTAVSLVAMVAACAGPGNSGPRSASTLGGKMNAANIGLASKAQMALETNDPTTAISFAERAVEATPSDASFRALLGNCYLAAGRFASAEAAYRDSLSLAEGQGPVLLKLALVQIAQGKNDQARSTLSVGQGVLDPSDTGLALALAGDPNTAIAILEPAARAVGADSRVRQNLALAHGFAGNWDAARTIAAQDVPGDQLDSRIQQWMTLAKPARASDQVASFIGIQPAASDPGQPVRLALHKADGTRQAEAVPIVAPVQAAELTSTATVELAPVEYAQPAPVAVAAYDAPAPAPIQPAAVEIAAAPVEEARPALSPAVAEVVSPVASLRRAALPKARSGNSRAVVQLGAYSSRDRISGAWSKVASKHSSLKAYTPVTAKYAGAKGTVYRLSVKGFASDREAVDLCSSLKRAGGSCFVRTVSGDAPVRLAWR